MVKIIEILNPEILKKKNRMIDSGLSEKDVDTLLDLQKEVSDLEYAQNEWREGL